MILNLPVKTLFARKMPVLFFELFQIVIILTGITGILYIKIYKYIKKYIFIYREREKNIFFKFSFSF